ncbi:MAG TPA: hypothetical protein VLJ11_14760 [Bryobacteraceae bacterium]|nr:hypothetical protein [Bryobacteraceae bacterium]
MRIVTEWRLLLEHYDHLAEDFVYVNDLLKWRTFSEQRSDMLYDVGCTSGVSDQFQCSFSCLRQVGVAAIS